MADEPAVPMDFDPYRDNAEGQPSLFDQTRDTMRARRAWAWEEKVARAVLRAASQEGGAGILKARMKETTGEARLTVDAACAATSRWPSYRTLLAQRLPRLHMHHLGVLFDKFSKTNIARAYSRHCEESKDHNLIMAFGPVVGLRGGILVIHGGLDGAARMYGGRLIVELGRGRLRVVEPLGQVLERLLEER